MLFYRHYVETMMNRIAQHVRCITVFTLIAFAGCAPEIRVPAVSADVLPASWEFLQDEPAATGTRGMIASDAPLASETGIMILRRGGNAIDAAVATAFALAVVMPEAGNIGGGGFLVLRMHDGTAAALDFREKAPLAARRDMYLDADGKSTDHSITGHLAAGVPGSVAGLFEAHRRFGRLPWRQVVEPAIDLADKGFVVTRDFAGSVRADSLRLARYPASAALFYLTAIPRGKEVCGRIRISDGLFGGSPKMVRLASMMAQPQT